MNNLASKITDEIQRAYDNFTLSTEGSENFMPGLGGPPGAGLAWSYACQAFGLTTFHKTGPLEIKWEWGISGYPLGVAITLNRFADAYDAFILNLIPDYREETKETNPNWGKDPKTDKTHSEYYVWWWRRAYILIPAILALWRGADYGNRLPPFYADQFEQTKERIYNQTKIVVDQIKTDFEGQGWADDLGNGFSTFPELTTLPILFYMAWSGLASGYKNFADECAEVQTFYINTKPATWPDQVKRNPHYIAKSLAYYAAKQMLYKLAAVSEGSLNFYGNAATEADELHNQLTTGNQIQWHFSGAYENAHASLGNECAKYPPFGKKYGPYCNESKLDAFDESVWRYWMDFDADGTITVVDIMQVAACWGEMGVNPADPNSQPTEDWATCQSKDVYDEDRGRGVLPESISICDIMQVAHRWRDTDPTPDPSLWDFCPNGARPSFVDLALWTWNDKTSEPDAETYWSGWQTADAANVAWATSEDRCAHVAHVDTLLNNIHSFWRCTWALLLALPTGDGGAAQTWPRLAIP